MEPRKAYFYHFTGFARTGDWFALKRYGVVPDILALAIGITSGYPPLDGITVSRPIHAAMTSIPYGDRWIHAYTCPGHLTCCAVGVRNLENLEEESLARTRGRWGARLSAGMPTLVLSGRGLHPCCRSGCDR